MLRELINTSETTAVEVARIRTDGGTQMRAEINWDTVHEYRDAMQAGVVLPPPVLFYDGVDYWVGDGFHRVAAWKLAHQAPGMPNECTRPIDCEVRSGTRRDAVLHAAGANAAHGLRRTQADKRRAVETLLRDQEWGVWSDNEIARRCNVSATTVGTVRKQLSLSNLDSEKPAAPAERQYTTKHGTVATMQTASIGSNKPVDKVSLTQLIDLIQRAPNLRVSDLRSAARNKRGHWLYDKTAQNAQAHWPGAWTQTQLVQALQGVADRLEQRLQAQSAVSPEQRQYESAVPAIQPTDVPAWVPPGLGGRVPQSAPVAEPTLPADLQERGWMLRRVGGFGKWYCNNPSGHRATSVHERADDAIAEAYTMQVDLRSAPAAPEPEPEPDADAREAQAFAAAATHLDAAVASLQAAYRAIAGHHDELQASIVLTIDDVKLLRKEVEL